MINKDKLINTHEVIYQDMFDSNSNENYSTRNNGKTFKKLDKLINTNEIFYEDMTKSKFKQQH